VTDEVWNAVDADLLAGRRTLRDVLAFQASQIAKSENEALDFVAEHARVDPSFAPFVRRAQAAGAEVVVLSSGIAPIIRTTLDGVGLSTLAVYANEVDFAPGGWTMTFIDDSANGHDKAAAVRRARQAGVPTVYVGDGVSDFDAAREAERCFAKTGRALERYGRERGLGFISFSSFAEIERSLFGEPAVY
jgi:2,3-diketo-5-methylthio-1-phosphopentane phosphatase